MANNKLSISELLNPRAIRQLEVDGGVTLREPSEPDSYTRITQCPRDTVIISLEDRFLKSFKDLLSEELEGIRCCADFLLVSETEKVIVYIEMKKRDDTTKHIVNQLKGAHCILEYVRKIGQIFCDSEFLKDFQNRYVCLRHVNVSKTKTWKSQGNGNHDTPEKMLVLDGSYARPFKALIKGER